MKARLMSALLLGCALPLAAQPSAPQARSSDLGFSYSPPAGWEILNGPPVAAAGEEGTGCIQTLLTARHGTPPSVIVVVGAPFDCYGQTLVAGDLPNFGQGMAKGLEKDFNASFVTYGAYNLGSHSIWIEREEGSLTDRPDRQDTLEIACAVLKKAAVCWMAMAVDPAALVSFESSTVTLEGEATATLVPPAVFPKNVQQ